MRLLMQVRWPNEPFGQMVRDGVVGQKMQELMEATAPEAAYFTEQDGSRAAVFVVNVNEDSDVPGLAEPWFLTLNAEVHFAIAMTPEDLGRAGLDELGERWG